MPHGGLRTGGTSAPSQSQEPGAGGCVSNTPPRLFEMYTCALCMCSVRCIQGSLFLGSRSTSSEAISAESMPFHLLEGGSDGGVLVLLVLMLLLLVPIATAIILPHR